jgi:hypothetical protein
LAPCQITNTITSSLNPIAQPTAKTIHLDSQSLRYPRKSKNEEELPSRNDPPHDALHSIRRNG